MTRPLLPITSKAISKSTNVPCVRRVSPVTHSISTICKTSTTRNGTANSKRISPPTQMPTDSNTATKTSRPRTGTRSSAIAAIIVTNASRRTICSTFTCTISTRSPADWRWPAIYADAFVGTKPLSQCIGVRTTKARSSCAAPAARDSRAWRIWSSTCVRTPANGRSNAIGARRVSRTYLD